MPNNDYDIDKKIEISANEMCNVIAKVMAEEPFDSLIEEDPLMIITLPNLEQKLPQNYLQIR